MAILDTLVLILGQTILPISLVVLVGLILARRLALNTQTIGRVTFYLFSPALIFRGLYQTDLDYSTVGRTALLAALLFVVSGLLGWLSSAGEERRRRAAIALTSALSNNGNMGLSVSLFAFGEPGLALAMIYFVTTAFLGNTVGVFVASSGKAKPLEALRRTAQVPMLYGAILGLLLGYFQVELPLGLMRSVDTLAGAAVPTLLVLLGAQLSQAPIQGRQLVLARTSFIRLAGGPILAVLFCLLFGVSGLERTIVILQSAMPTAVSATVLATEYDAAPNLVATIVATTTVVSLVSVSGVLWMLS
ncbi:MAG: AEC family transporter [Caldilineaceae bacterium]|nr:AEC family transporter [Caldilineaceae bacterium]